MNCINGRFINLRMNLERLLFGNFRIKLINVDLFTKLTSLEMSKKYNHNK